MSVALAAAGWVAGVLLLWRLPLVPAAGRPARASVVVPARNEAASLPRLLASLRGSEADVVVVDDESTDATAAVAVAGGARVVASGGPPDGWTGKAWACEVGVGSTNRDVVAVVDADTWFEADGFARVVAAHGALAPDGLLSVQPFHVTGRAHEQLSAAANVVSVMATGMAAVVPVRSRPVAFGPCLVTTRAALEAVGGFASVRGAVVEDVALARRFGAAGRPVRCLAGGDAVRFRMYPDGARQLAEGWTKNLAAGATRAPVVPALGAVVWVTGALSVAVGAVVAPGPAVAVAWAAYAGHLAWALRRLGSFRWWAWALFPVPVGAFVVLVAASVVARARGTASWRGRAVALRRG